MTPEAKITHLQNHDYDDILRTHCGKSNYDIYVDREEWVDDVAEVDCDKCLELFELRIRYRLQEVQRYDNRKS